MTTTKRPECRVRISFRAMFQRLNRALKKRHQVAKAPRGRGAKDGEYFVLNVKRERAVAANLSVEGLEKLAREVGAIRPWEEVER